MMRDSFAARIVRTGEAYKDALTKAAANLSRGVDMLPGRRLTPKESYEEALARAAARLAAGRSLCSLRAEAR